MRKPLAACGALVLGLLFTQAPGVAHHPIAPEFDDNRELTLTGTVEKFEWQSPHSLLELETKEGERAKTWSIELDGESALDSLGWSRDTLSRGQQVTVQAWPARDGSARAVAWAVQLQDGRELAAINPHDPAWAAHAERRDQQRAGAAREVALIGCIALERDVRQPAGARPDGAPDADSMGNQFVLVDARPAPDHLAQADAVGTTGDASHDRDRADAGRDAQSGATAGAVGTSGTAQVYSLTGDEAGAFDRAVGRQVHVIGVIEDEGRDRDADPSARAGDLPRVSVTAWHPVNDFCPAEPEQGVAQPQGAQSPAQSEPAPAR